MILFKEKKIIIKFISSSISLVYKEKKKNILLFSSIYVLYYNTPTSLSLVHVGINENDRKKPHRHVFIHIDR
jgi:hypothetical protein